jgi:hypothetical protein
VNIASFASTTGPIMLTVGARSTLVLPGAGSRPRRGPWRLRPISDPAQKAEGALAQGKARRGRGRPARSARVGAGHDDHDHDRAGRPEHHRAGRPEQLGDTRFPRPALRRAARQPHSRPPSPASVHGSWAVHVVGYDVLERFGRLDHVGQQLAQFGFLEWRQASVLLAAK